MTVQDRNSTSRRGAEHSEKITVALVSKYASEGIGGIENHLDMLLRHVQTPSCSYTFVTGFDSGAQRSGGTRGYLRFVHRLMRCRSELVHFHGFDRLQLLTLMLFARRRIPLVVTPHNGVAGIVNDRNAVRRLAKRWADGVLFPALIRQRARVIALTVEERDYYLARFPGCSDLVEVLPNPIEKHRWASLQPGSAPARLLALSRLDWWKHIEDLISAMALLPPEVECDIAGPDWGAAAALQNQARQVARTIRFHGAVRGAEKERLFEDATIVVVPSKAEGLSTVALEALARGIPVIASDLASRGLPAEGVYRYRFRSVVDLARTIEHLLAGENLLMARRAARRASTALVGYDDYARALRSLYRLSVERHRNGITPRATDHGRLRASSRGRPPE
ncbi:MAG: glycosyltransferase family 4 protein [Streptosporangiaceae bacterium]